MSVGSRRSGSGAKSVPLTREALTKLKRKACRKGVWFRDLKQSERKLLSLTISVVERVRSFMLVKLVSQIVDRLCEALESRVYRLMRTEGRRLAEGLSKIAETWGYSAAKSWVEDRGFRQFLVVNNLSYLKA